MRSSSNYFLPCCENGKTLHVFRFPSYFGIFYIEHSGLGRYGDPIDPFGDIREIHKIRCLLKPGGILHLGLPVGRDSLVFNAHRIYGQLRLAMLFEGFKLIDAFESMVRYSIPLNVAIFEKEIGQLTQVIFVLQKI
ncbi:unnamed protein product [Dracunculus medinensis]|uniref:SAM-dependent methyltransferase n=1 Tax=Dracunculus medinensis TaxID=318479 RepID=A0A0N4U791_DRAME|nr:unnamed protein product [Dracunculus medinensis]